MKTAMQKLKSISKNLHEKYHEDITLQWLVDNIDDFIKEEKEQIIDAFDYGYHCASNGTSAEITLDGKMHYNQTYNQNK